MTTVNYWSHIPHVRIDTEVAEFGPGRLWRVPFDVWDYLMVGAFTDHQEAYDATAPVSFYVETEVDWEFLTPWDSLESGRPEHTTNIEAKVPSLSEDDVLERFGLGFMTHFVDLACVAQAALTLSAPASAPGSPRMSVTMFKPDDAVIDLGGIHGTGARIEGDADHEWMLMPEAAGETFDATSIANGSMLYDFAWQATHHGDLRPAIDALLTASHPALDARQRLVLCTVALEALLMPEAQSQLASTFRRRVATLLDPMPMAEEAARVLYQARSAALHGDEARSSDSFDDLAQRCVAQQVLAATVLAVGPAVLQGARIEEVRLALDHGVVPDDRLAVPTHDLATRPLVEQAYRLIHQAPSSVVAVLSEEGRMHADDGEHVAWCPLIGLRSEGLIVSSSGTFSVDSLEGADLMELEERDIRRDFMSNVAAKPDGMPVQALLGLLGLGEADLTALAQRRRDAVLALRLAGFSRFVDPALLGWFVFEGNIRTRIPSVLRQSVIQRAAHEADQEIGPIDEDRVAGFAQLLASYRTTGGDAEVDALLDGFLLAHPNDFLPGEASATLLLATVESALGRFRPRSAERQLEDLVSVVADSEAALWFAAEGRSFRNAVAHGRWVAGRGPRAENVELDSLISISRAVVHALLEHASTERNDDTDVIVGFRRCVESHAA